MKVMVWWSVLIGAACGIYAGLFNYFHVGPFIWMTFVALPIYFGGAGAAPKAFPRYWASAIFGVASGWFYLQVIKWFAQGNMEIHWNLGITVGVVTAVVCMVGLAFAAKTWLNVLPMMFGGIASTFAMSASVESAGIKQYFWVASTLTLGLLLALACAQTMKLVPWIMRLGRKPQAGTGAGSDRGRPAVSQ